MNRDGGGSAPQPEADEDVKTLAQVLFKAAGNAYAQGFSIHEGMAHAALAWAARRYGGEVAALRGALATIVREEAAVGHPACACQSCTRARAALSLTPSAAAEAVQRLVEAAAERDRLRQSAMRLLSAIANAQSEGGAADPLGAFKAVQSAEDELEDLIPADVWAAFHAAREASADEHDSDSKEGSR